jgi:DNA processing protein
MGRAATHRATRGHSARDRRTAAATNPRGELQSCSDQAGHDLLAADLLAGRARRSNLATAAMNFDRGTPEELLRPLNEAEQKHAPKDLFVAGDRSLLRSGPAVAIVGSREASPAGLARADKLARLLVKHGVIVMSGLAEGIDTAAHLGAMKHGGRTIAVLGTPLDQCFPAKNRGLQSDIMRDHLAVTQFASGTKVGKHTFPMRNRTMALLSDATVIIEAKDSSGSLHQGWEAIRLGRPLFLAKSLFDDAALEFPREFERYGAEVLTDETLAALIEQLPQGPRGTVIPIPF